MVEGAKGRRIAWKYAENIADVDRLYGVRIQVDGFAARLKV